MEKTLDFIVHVLYRFSLIVYVCMVWCYIGDDREL